jgi:hypothetical protein
MMICEIYKNTNHNFHHHYAANIVHNKDHEAKQTCKMFIKDVISVINKWLKFIKLAYGLIMEHNSNPKSSRNNIRECKIVLAFVS